MSQESTQSPDTSRPPAASRRAPERALSLALAAVLALLPLLPTGPEYLHLPAGAWVELGLLMLLVIALLSLALERRARPRLSDDEDVVGPSPLVWGWLAFLFAVVGAAAVGILRENEPGTLVFQAYLRELPEQLIAPMNQATHPLYPVRVAITFFEGFLAFLLVVWICRRASDARQRALTALSGWTIGFGLTAAFAVVQNVTRYRLHPYWVEVNPNLARSHATLDDPNALGSFMCLGLGITLGLFFAWRKDSSRPWARWATAGVVVLGALGLGATVSRSAWAAAVLAVVLLLASPLPLARDRSRALSWLRLGARGALAVFLLVVLLSLAARAWVTPRPGYKPTGMADVILATLDPRNPIQDVLEGRLIWWTAGSRMYMEHPITGVGLGRFPRLLPEYQDAREIYENAHNFYLQVAAVMGSVGLVAFLYFLVTLAATLRPALARPGSRDAGLALGLTFGLIAFLLTCLSGNALLLPSIQLLLATGLAAALVAVSAPMRDSRRLWVGGALVMVVVVLLTYTVAVARAQGPAHSDDPWGYAWGLHAPETDPTGAEYRWTGEEALLYLMPHPGAHQIELSYAPGQPVRDGVPTEVWMKVEGQSHIAYCSEDTWCQVHLPLPEDSQGARHGGITLRLTVDPPFIPAASGESSDTRELGVMLRPPRFLPPPDR